MAMKTLTPGTPVQADPGDEFVVFLKGSRWPWWDGTQYHIQVFPADPEVLIGLYSPDGSGLANNAGPDGTIKGPYVDRSPSQTGFHRIKVTRQTMPYAIIVVEGSWAQKAFGGIAVQLQHWLALHNFKPTPPPAPSPPPAPTPDPAPVPKSMWLGPP